MSNPFSIEWRGLSEFGKAIDRILIQTDEATRTAVAEVGHRVEAAAKEHANGRPGPIVRTGKLRRSIRTAPITRWGARGWQTEVGPTAVYGPRIELGFTGTDSIGRHYDQPPYPYMQPGLESVDVEAIFTRAWREVA